MARSSPKAIRWNLVLLVFLLLVLVVVSYLLSTGKLVLYRSGASSLGTLYSQPTPKPTLKPTPKPTPTPKPGSCGKGNYCTGTVSWNSKAGCKTLYTNTGQGYCQQAYTAGRGYVLCSNNANGCASYQGDIVCDSKVPPCNKTHNEQVVLHCCAKD
jgi:hypothetical protein